MGNDTVEAKSVAFKFIPLLSSIIAKIAPKVNSAGNSPKGSNLNCCQPGGDPVNMTNGNFMYEKEYLRTKGLFPISFCMFYNAQEQRLNSLGHGWVHNFEVSIEIEEQQATVILEDGTQEIFYRGKNGRYSQSQGVINSLSETDDTLVYQTNEGFIYTFNSRGKLIREEDRNSNYIELSYDNKARLVTVANNSAAEFNFSYENGKLKQITDNTGRAISFEYQRDTLICVTDENNGKHKYDYDSQNRIAKLINPLGIDMLKNEYDDSNRIKRQEFPDGGVITTEYLEAENKVLTTEQNGNKIGYVHDNRFRSVATIYEDGTEKYGYNEQNLRTQYVDKKGNETKYSYDDRGNLVKTTNPLGETANTDYNDLNKPVRIKQCGTVMLSMAYDPRGNVTNITDALGRTSKVEYNANGRPIKIIQPDDSETTIAYDKRGNIIAITDTYSTTEYEYDALNRVTTTTDGNGNKTQFEYNVKDDITKVTNAEGYRRSYEYNTDGKITKIIDFDGSEIIREYNCLSKPGKLVDQEGNETKLEYDMMWNVVKLTDANGNMTVFEYNKLNRLEKVINPKGSKTKYEYDPNGNRTKVCGPRGEEIYLSYDPLNRISRITEPNGAKTGIKYDCMGQITSITNALGNESKFTYDKAGQKISEVDPAGREQKYSYNMLGQISEATDAAGRTTKFEYLPGGLLSKVLYPDGRSTEYAYNANKSVISQTSQDGLTFYFEYDCLNQVTKISSNKGQEKKYTYDAIGNVTSMTDTNGNTSKYMYTLTGNLLAVIDPLGNRFDYNYDKLGNLIEVKQFTELYEANKLNEHNSRRHVTKYERDALGQIERIIDALGNTEVYTFDESGNVTSKLDKASFLTKYAYSATNQLEEVVYADGKSVKLSYNPLKQLTEIKDWLGVTTIEVDEVGRAKKITDHKGREVEYTFGSENERTAIKYPDGKIVEYKYDEALRLKTLVDGDKNVDYVYDEHSRLCGKLFPNGVSTKYTYNDIGLLAELTHSDKEGVLDKYAYTYDSMLNMAGIEKYRRGMDGDSGKYQYTYDPLSRLTGVAKDDKLIKTFGYDGFGNRSFMVDKGSRTDYSYNPLNQLLSLKNTKITQDFRYDARGNLTQVLENNKIKNTYEYSQLNRLTKAANANGQIAQYEYNGLGFRVGKQIIDNLNPTKDISYVLDLTKHYHNLLQMTDEMGVKNYAWDFNVVSEDGSAESRFYLQDELGSPLRFTGVDGALVDSYAYDEFGNDQVGNQSVMQPFGFTGYQHDSIAQTYFAQAREYQPLIGRFIAQDTHWHPDNMIYGDGNSPVPDMLSLRQAGNLYSYCLYSPLLFVDLTGNDLVTLMLSNEIHRAVSNDILYGDPNPNAIKLLIRGGGLPSPSGRYLAGDVKIDYCPAAKAYFKSISGYGYADIADINTGEMWEIKTNQKGDGILEATLDVNGYVLWGNTYARKKKLDLLARSELQGKTPNIGPANTFQGRFTYQSELGDHYIVTYHNPEPGVIIYEYTKYTPKLSPKEVIPVLLTLLLLILSRGNLKVPLPCPAI